MCEPPTKVTGHSRLGPVWDSIILVACYLATMAYAFHTVAR